MFDTKKALFFKVVVDLARHKMVFPDNFDKKLAMQLLHFMCVDLLKTLVQHCEGQCYTGMIPLLATDTELGFLCSVAGPNYQRFKDLWPSMSNVYDEAYDLARHHLQGYPQLRPYSMYFLVGLLIEEVHNVMFLSF